MANATFEESQIAEELHHVQLEVQRFAQYLDKLTVASADETKLANDKGRRSPPLRTAQAGGETLRPAMGWKGGRQPALTSRSTRASEKGKAHQSRCMPLPTTGENSGTALCYRCGRRAHSQPTRCPAINRICYLCSKRGHLMSCCRSAGRRKPPSVSDNDE